LVKNIKFLNWLKKMAMTKGQKWGLATLIVVILLIIFLYKYFLGNKKEKCPDGSNVPADGNCVQKDSAGNTIAQPAPKPDAAGCIKPASYTLNHFPLTLGMKGDFVKQLQIALNTQFNAKVSEDGFFGCLTLAAMKKAFNIETMDAQFFNDKIQTPLSLDNPIS
jgi:hypothetical protein